jgi:hypothetical protein
MQGAGRYGCSKAPYSVTSTRQLQTVHAATEWCRLSTLILRACCILVLVQAVRIVGGLLRRLSTEVWWRGFVVAGLAGWLYSTWESGGEGQGC